MPPPKRLHYDPYRDYYVVLSVHPHATPDEIQKAYRARAKVLHPDRNSAPDATTQFQLLNEAYQTLRDPSERDLYDQLRAKALGLRLPRKPVPQGSLPGARPGGEMRAALRGLFRGPYRTVFMTVGIVIIANLVFILFVPAMSGLTAIRPTGTASIDMRELPDICTGDAVLISPTDGASVSGTFDIIGTAKGAYVLEWSTAVIGADGRLQPYEWQVLTSGEAAIEKGVLARSPQTAVLPMSGRVRLRIRVGDAACEVTVQR